MMTLFDPFVWCRCCIAPHSLALRADKQMKKYGLILLVLLPDMNKSFS